MESNNASPLHVLTIFLDSSILFYCKSLSQISEATIMKSQGLRESPSDFFQTHDVKYKALRI